MSSSSTLSDTEKIKLSQQVNQLSGDRLFSRVLSALKSSGVKITFAINSSQASSGVYSPNSTKISFRSIGDIDYMNVAEELLHAYQGSYYSNMPSSLSEGKVDREFEANFLR